jgi:hypothetical protein
MELRSSPFSAVGGTGGGEGNHPNWLGGEGGIGFATVSVIPGRNQHQSLRHHVGVEEGDPAKRIEAVLGRGAVGKTACQPDGRSEFDHGSGGREGDNPSTARRRSEPRRRSRPPSP